MFLLYMAKIISITTIITSAIVFIIIFSIAAILNRRAEKVDKRLEDINIKYLCTERTNLLNDLYMISKHENIKFEELASKAARVKKYTDNCEPINATVRYLKIYRDKYYKDLGDYLISTASHKKKLIESTESIRMYSYLSMNNNGVSFEQLIEFSGLGKIEIYLFSVGHKDLSLTRLNTLYVEIIKMIEEYK